MISAAARNRTLLMGISSSVLTRGLAFLLAVIGVPTAYHHLGAERYGSWVTLLSMLGWLTMLDFGLSNGVLPCVAVALGRGDGRAAREYVSTSFWTLALIAAVGSCAVLFLPNLDWLPGLTGSNSTAAAAGTGQAFTAIALLGLAMLPFALASRVLLAGQWGTASNFCHLLVSGCGFAGLWVASRTTSSLRSFAICTLGAQLLASFAITTWLFARRAPSLNPLAMPSRKRAGELVAVSGFLWILQIATFVNMHKDLLLVANTYGSATCAQYALTWQLFVYTHALHAMAAPYIAPGFGHAFASNDRQWIRKTYLRYLQITAVVGVSTTLVVVLLHRTLLNAWVHHQGGLGWMTTSWQGAWMLVLTILGPPVALLQGIGRLRLLAVAYAGASALSLAVSAWAAGHHGPHVGPMTSTIFYIALVVPVAMLEARRVCAAHPSAAAIHSRTCPDTAAARHEI